MRGRAAASAVVACVALALATAGAAGPERPESPLKKVVFSFTPDRCCSRVFLAGTFNEWSTDATEMRKANGRFEVTLPLPTGEYQYKFVADGRWITDENASGFHPNGFGGRNSVIVVDRSFPRMAIERGDGRILEDGVSHRQGARERSLNADGSVTLRMRTWTGDVERVQLWLEGRDVPPEAPVGPSDTDGTSDYYSWTVESRLAHDCPSYRFLLADGRATLWLGPKGMTRDGGAAGWFRFDLSDLVTFATPDWVKEGTIYQIFPERFANGDPENDPDFSEWYYEGVNELPPSGKTNGEYFHLVEDWYDACGLSKSPYKTDGKPDWNSFYGGDIDGVRQNLDYLADLGVTIIYFNPLFRSKSNHKYDAASYTEIDPHFGTNEEFLAFVTECHGRGIRVVIDLALNHTGHTFWAFVDAREKGRDSEYWDWYEWKSWPLPGGSERTPRNPLDYYDCWWGFGQMPNLNFDLSLANPDEHGVRDIEDAAPNWPLVEHLLDAATYWIGEIGVDGYRLDVAGEVPFWFWELFRERVKGANPDAYIVGELWGASPEWVNGRYCDAVMNYKFFREPVLGFIARGTTSAEEFDRALAPGRLIYPEDGVRAQMNLLGSHDTERFLSIAGGDIRRLKLAALFAMTYVGVPTIYYGDEIAMTGGGDPDCRRPFYWKWKNERARVEVHDYFRRLADLRKTIPCLVHGDFETLCAEGSVFAYRRRSGEHSAVVVLNASEEGTTITVPLGPTPPIPEGAVARSMASPDGGPLTVITGENGRDSITVTLPPLAGTILLPLREAEVQQTP